MERVVKVQEAKTHFSALLAEVEAGAQIVISRGDTPVARLVPLETAPRKRELGFLSFTLPDSFHDELPEDELVAWEQ